MRNEWEKTNTSTETGRFDRGLVLHIQFDREDGAIVDNSPSHFEGVHGRAADAMFSTDAIRGKSLRCARGQDFVSVFPFRIDTDLLTVSAWINVGALRHESWRHPVVSHHGERGGWELRATADSVEFAMRISGQPSRAIGQNTVSPGRWHHLVGTYNGSYVTIWMDGEKLHSVKVSGRPTPYDGALNIGRNPHWNERQFRGLIDEVRIYNRPLTDNEIRLLHKTR